MVYIQIHHGFRGKIMSNIFTNKYLDTLKFQADPALDKLVHDAAGQLNGIKTMTAMFKRVIESPRLTLAELETMRNEKLITKEIIEFFEQHSSVPTRPWIYPEQLHAGGEFFRDRGVLGFLSLACASLPACYCMTDEAYILGCTGRLENKNEIPRRIPETAKFVLDIVSKGSMEPDGIGLHAANKVRLMHSIIRYLIISKEAMIADGHSTPVDRHEISDETGIIYGHDWSDERGAPISQELMVGTLLTFHYLVLDGYERMKIKVSDEEKIAYLQRWNVVGYFLGVDERVLAQLYNMENAQRMFDLIMQRNRARSEDGQKLQSTLLEYMRKNIIDRVLGGFANPLIVVPRIMTRQLSGKQTSKSLDLKLGIMGTLLRYPVWWCMQFVGRMSNWRFTRRISHRLMVYVAKHLWDWRTAPDDYYDKDGLAPHNPERKGIIVHPSLAEHWNLK